jgi:DNA-binding IclR family transcriptional regulator
MEAVKTRVPDGEVRVSVKATVKKPVAKLKTAGLNRSVARALNILLEVAHSEKPKSFVDFQKELRLPKATLHKLLYTLERLNFLRRDDDTNKYSMGLAALEIAAGGGVRPGDLRSALDPVLRRLVEEWNETCHLGVLDGSEEIILDRLDPPRQVVRLATKVGRRHPAYCSAGGLASLAARNDDETYLASLPEELPAVTKHTMRSRVDLRARIREVREKGYALDLEEAYPGVRCVGVAVSVPGWPIVAISFSLPLQRASIERLRELSKPLLLVAKQVQRLLELTPNA